MNKKILLTLILGAFLIGLASASLENLGTFKQGDCLNISQTCSTCTYVNISSVSNKDNSTIISNVEMTNFGNGEWRYNFCDTSYFGRYDVKGQGDINGVDTSFAIYFDVTYYGTNLSEGQGTLYIILLVVLFFIFGITLFGINKLPARNKRDEQGRILSVTYLKYLRDVLWFFEWMIIIAILYLSSNLAFAYLQEQLFANILFTLYRIFFALTPVIVTIWMIWIIASMFHDREFQRMLNRGIFPQGKL